MTLGNIEMSVARMDWQLLLLCDVEWMVHQVSTGREGSDELVRSFTLVECVLAVSVEKIRGEREVAGLGGRITHGERREEKEYGDQHELACVASSEESIEGVSRADEGERDERRSREEDCGR